MEPCLSGSYRVPLPSHPHSLVLGEEEHIQLLEQERGPQPPASMFPVLPLLGEGLVLGSALCLLVSLSVPRGWPFSPVTSFTNALQSLASETCRTYSPGTFKPFKRRSNALSSVASEPAENLLRGP